MRAMLRTWVGAFEVFILEAILEERRGCLVSIARGILYLLSGIFNS